MIRGAEIWITEDGLELSLRIAAELSLRGFKPRVVNLDEPFITTVPERLAGLIIVAPADGTHDRQLWRSIEWLQKAGPALRRMAAQGTSLFATVSRLDGRFGFDAGQRLADPTSGGLAGLVKSAAREWPELNCKAVDLAAWPSLSEAAVRVVDELFRKGPVEIGLSPQGRCSPVVVEEPLDRFRTGTPVLQPGELVLVSGGARGVTAAAALAAAQAWKSQLVILGRSPIPPEEPDWLKRLSSEVEIKQSLIQSLPKGTLPKAIEAQYRQILSQREVSASLSRLAAAGVPVSYHAVDIRDLATVRPLLLQLQDEFGPVRGVIHGAGVLADQRIEDKTRDQFDRVYQTKVAGLRNLLGAIAPDELRMLCLFSSYTARFGRIGQCDYAMANEVLNKLARQFSIDHPQTHVVSFNWGPWDGGMVTGGLKKLFAAENVGLIPMDDGASLLVQELSQVSSLPVEVLVLGRTDAPVAASTAGVPTATNAAPSVAESPSVAGPTTRIESLKPEPAERRESSNILLSGDAGSPRSTAPARPIEHVPGSSNVLLAADTAPNPRASAPAAAPVRPQGSSNVLLAGSAPEPANERPPAPQPGPSGSWVFAEIGQTGGPEAGDLKIAFERTLDVKQYPFLESHVIGGKAVMPVAMMLEWLAHGTIHHNPGLELEGFDHFRVFHGVRLDRHDSPLLRVMVGKAVRTGGRFTARTQLVGSSAGRDVVHAAGNIVLTSQHAAGPDPRLQVALRGYSLDMATAYATKLFHGSHLQGIAAVEACSPDGIVVDSRTSPAPWAWMREPLRSAWIADPLSIDAALQAVILWSQEIHGVPCLPCSIGGYRQYRKVFPHTGVKIVVQITQATDHSIRADVEFLDLQGQLVAQMTGCESVADASLVSAFQRNRLES
jgi:NAD(P)-dependent dehydrogenase (short-subunit alcohol dehydrogenase family)